MPDLITSLMFGVALFAVAWFVKRKIEDKVLNARLAGMLLEARTVLPSDDLERLTDTLRELHTVGFVAHQQGQSSRDAGRMVKEAAIQTVANFIELNRMFSTDRRCL